MSDWLAGALLLLVVAAFALGYWHAFYKATFHGLFINDAWDYASMARNIALGRGVLSEYLTPLGLAHLGVPQPDLWRAPLWPVLLALFQKVFGFKDEASALAGGACFGAGACLVFLLGRRWFNLPVAVAATLLYIFSSQLLIFANSGLTEPLSVLLMLAWFYLLTGPCPDAWWQPLLAGAAGGLFYLARYNAGLFFLPAAGLHLVAPALKRKPGAPCGGGAFNTPLDFNHEIGRCIRPCWRSGAPGQESGNHRPPDQAGCALHPGHLAGDGALAGPQLHPHRQSLLHPAKVRAGHVHRHLPAVQPLHAAGARST